MLIETIGFFITTGTVMISFIGSVAVLFYRVKRLERVDEAQAKIIAELHNHVDEKVDEMKEKSEESLRSYMNFEQYEHKRIIDSVNNSINSLSAKIDLLLEYNLNNKK